MRQTSILSWLSIALLMLLTAVGLLSATPHPMDDHFLYQKFIESLAVGRLDLTIAGFHGSDFFAVPVYWVTGSAIAQIYFQMLAAIFLPLCGFLAGRSLYRSAWHGVALAVIVTMMPFISFVSLRGWTGAAYWDLMLLSIASVRRFPIAAGFFWGFAMLTKPFAVILGPLLFVMQREEKNAGQSLLKQQGIKKWIPLLIAGGIVVLYMIIQYLQAGRIIIGAHTELGAGNFFQSPYRMFLNLAHAVQILFSVHNYYFPDPGLTGPGNMMHTSPVLVFLGLFAMLAPGQFFEDRRMAIALLFGAVAGMCMSAMMDHMDHFYMEAGVLMFIVAALPVLKKHPVWIAVALATLQFQWLYFWLNYQESFALNGVTFFLIPAVIDVSSLVALMASSAGSISPQSSAPVRS